MLVSVAVCLEEDAPVSVFSLQEVEREVPSVEEVSRKGQMCLWAMSVFSVRLVWTVSGFIVVPVICVYCTFHRA